MVLLSSPFTTDGLLQSALSFGHPLDFICGHAHDHGRSFPTFILEVAGAFAQLVNQCRPYTVPIRTAENIHDTNAPAWILMVSLLFFATTYYSYHFSGKLIETYHRVSSPTLKRRRHCSID
jgi:hypothetical protein